jgi:hypothetical protein
MPVRYTVPIVFVQRVKSGTDVLGNDVFTPTSMTIDGVFAPGGSVETVQGQDVVVMQPTVYLPTGTVVGAVDAVQVAGATYEVDGQPNAWPPNPFSGWQPPYSVEVKLKRVTG